MSEIANESPKLSLDDTVALYKPIEGTNEANASRPVTDPTPQFKVSDRNFC